MAADKVPYVSIKAGNRQIHRQSNTASGNFQTACVFTDSYLSEQLGFKERQSALKICSEDHEDREMPALRTSK